DRPRDRGDGCDDEGHGGVPVLDGPGEPA
ncbi:MAG: hypothetical protein RIR04_1930, partial [Pseudomonadota bacterium]